MMVAKGTPTPPPAPQQPPGWVNAIMRACSKIIFALIFGRGCTRLCGSLGQLEFLSVLKMASEVVIVVG